MSTAPVISPSDVMKLAQGAALKVYNPGTPIVVEAGGRFYDAPEKGTFDVVALMQHPRRRTEGGKVVTIMDELEPQPGGTAHEVVQTILSRYQHRGLVLLQGDARDAGWIEDADAKFFSWRIDYAESVESSWIQKVQAYATLQPGAPPPRQPKLVRNELLFLQKYRTNRVGRLEYICPVCSLEMDRVDGPDGFDEHRRTAHPALSAEVGPVRNPGPAPAPAAVGTPGTEADPDDDRGLRAADLHARARQLGVTLLKDELIGLLDDDETVINNVIKKLAKAQAEKSRG